MFVVVVGRVECRRANDAYCFVSSANTNSVLFDNMEDFLYVYKKSGAPGTLPRITLPAIGKGGVRIRLM